MLQATDFVPPWTSVGCPSPTLGTSHVPDRARCSQQHFSFGRISDARHTVDQCVTLATAEPVYLAFRAACQQHILLHRGTSRRCFSRCRTLFTAPRRRVARRPHGTQKPGSVHSTRTVARRLLSATLQKGNTCLQRFAMLDPATVGGIRGDH